MKMLFQILIIILVSLSACSKDIDELQKDKVNPYSISLGTFKTYEHALKFKMKLNDSVRIHLRLESVGKKSYKLFFGKYPSSYSAGEKAFDLFCKKFIKEYEICRNGQRVLDEFVNIPFVAEYLGKPAVYNYNLQFKTTEILWSRYKKKVMFISLTPNYKSLFILTAEMLNKNRSSTSIQNAEVYFLHRNEDESEQLMSLGNVNNIYAYWDQPDTLRMNSTFPDSSNPRIIYQRILSWDSNGRRGSIAERTYDLLLHGYPIKPTSRPELYSPNGQYQLRIAQSNESKYFYLKNIPDRSEVLIYTLNGEINTIKWSPDSRYLFVQTNTIQYQGKNQKPYNREFLAIYNLEAKKIVKIIQGAGFNNLLVRGKLLFYDEHLNGKSHISILDMEGYTRKDSIIIFGGCSLNKLQD